ncbi:hypothetical protein PTSG_05355 [Salpingoeca rosetta]|uniref:COMM domain-containing protein n=1 Tax=Salpingoeca rosetta (strain ATCC 50818 / BSB-021) TaxID=946362 RepID=F2UA70_SALR5|nr:uncharacterized protein PTSG_05355 [Salpingoeca rosetta]EGD73645.1 hypothetical protein PTSG_05355 [Salpingoeca rosetta]|eukprot:XP_004993926.1 hypothetical protein PTSG_05355 [Salpingoeca rosetta]
MEAGLTHLMNAPDKGFVNQVFVSAFSARLGTVSADLVEKSATAMSLELQQAQEMFRAVIELINLVLFENLNTADGIKEALPSGLHGKLKSLVANIITHNLPAWREQTANSQLSLPRLKKVDWRVDIKTSSDRLAAMSMPTAVVQLTVDGATASQSDMAAPQSIAFEASKDTLETMLDGLGKIRDQLASIADAAAE